MNYHKILFTVVLLVLPCQLNAQTRSNILYPDADPRGEPELVVCSQNLQNYGSAQDTKTRMKIDIGQFEEKEYALVSRFYSKNCDLIILQEVLAKDEFAAVGVLNILAELLRKRTNREYEASSGPSNDPALRQGFIVAKDRAEILGKVSYEKIELPKLNPKDPPQVFSRGPLELQLRVNGRDGTHPKNLTAVNIHFKSKRGGKEDPAQLEWETQRMQMAEAVRKIVEKRHSRSFSTGQSILLVAGDRNSHWDTASAKILEGSLVLRNFKEGGGCRLSKRGMPLCKAQAAFPQKLFSVLTTDPQSGELPGTLFFQGEYSWLDDIIMPHESLPFAKGQRGIDGDYDSGVVYEPKSASDHAMVWVKLNW